MKKILGIALSGAACLSILNCTGSSSGTAGGGSATLSSYAATLAEDIVLASPTAKTSARRMLNKSIQPFAGPSADDTAAEKKEDLKDLLAAAPATCALSLTIMNPTNANCYGPSVNYTNHPVGGGSSSWPGGDLGIWETTEASTSEACSAAQLNSRMKGAASYVDLGTFLAAGMACVATKDSIAMPAESTSVDLTSNMSGLVNINASVATVTSAILERAADVSGFPVYIYSLTATSGTKTYHVRVKHHSLDSSDATYAGKVSVDVGDSNPASKTGNCSPSTATGSMEAYSMAYEKSSSTVAKLLMKGANFCGHDANPYVSVSNYSVDLTKAYTTTTVEKGWGNNANYFIGEFNPSTYVGKFSFAWQAGKGDSHSRASNTIISGTSTITGSTFFGFGPTMQVGPGAISGMICAWTGPDQSHTPASEVQRQDIEFSSGKFISTASNTTYDPVAAGCNSNSASFSMSWGAGPTTVTSDTTTKNLAPLSDVASIFGSQPTSPTEVD